MAETSDEMHQQTLLHIFENRNIKGQTKDLILAINDLVRYINVNLQDCQYATDKEWEEVLGSVDTEMVKKVSMAIRVSRQMKSQTSKNV